MFKKAKLEKIKRQHSVDLPINFVGFNDNNANGKTAVEKPRASTKEKTVSKFVENLKHPLDFFKKSSSAIAANGDDRKQCQRRSRSLVTNFRKRAEIAPGENSNHRETLRNFNTETTDAVIEFNTKTNLACWTNDPIESIHREGSDLNQDQKDVDFDERSSSVNTHYAMDNVVDWDPSSDDVTQLTSCKDVSEENDQIQSIAEPPSVINPLLNVDSSYHDRQDLLSAPILQSEYKNINFHILIKFVSPRQILQEEQTLWNLDYLITVLSKDSLQ